MFGPILRDWEQHRALRPHIKRRTIGAMVIITVLTYSFAELTARSRVDRGRNGRGTQLLVRVPPTDDPGRAGGEADRWIGTSAITRDLSGNTVKRWPGCSLAIEMEVGERDLRGVCAELEGEADSVETGAVCADLMGHEDFTTETGCRGPQACDSRITDIISRYRAASSE